MASRRLMSCLKHLIRVNQVWKPDSALSSRNVSCLSAASNSKLVNQSSVADILLNYSQTRNYPKGKEKPKSSGKKVEIREDLLEEHMNYKKFEMELENALNKMRDQFIKNVSLRSSAGAIENLVIEFEGEKYTIRDLAQINRKNPKLLALNFSNFPQTVPAVLQALSESGMNLNPQQDGASVYIPIPKVTREHRESLAKNAGQILHKCRSNLKETQSKYTKRLEEKQNEGLSKELYFILRDQVAEIVSQAIKEAEKMAADKNKELLGDG